MCPPHLGTRGLCALRELSQLALGGIGGTLRVAQDVVMRMPGMRLRGMAAWIRRIALVLLTLTPGLGLVVAYAAPVATGFSAEKHLPFVLGGMLIVQAIFMVMLILEHRRHRRARA